MMEDENRSNTIEEEDFLSAIIEIEMDHWGNDIAGTKAVLITLGCTAQKAEAALGSYLCPRSEFQVATERQRSHQPSRMSSHMPTKHR
jgi:hypothetical protein